MGQSIDQFHGNPDHQAGIIERLTAPHRAQIELGDDTSRRNASLLADVEYMSRQVQQLLHLAEASEVRNRVFEDIAVQEVAGEATSFLQRMAASAGVRLTVAVAMTVGATRWSADRGALFTLLKNLLENAIQHAPPHSEVTVEISHDEFSVRDYGAGSDANPLRQIFSRFWRGAHRKDSGAGLGLAICQEIALAHRWTLSVERATPGLRFRVSNEPLRPGPPGNNDASRNER